MLGYRDTALWLHRRGLQTLPARGKVCFLRGWPRYGKVVADRVEFEVLAAKYPKLNTALIMGPVNPLFAVDIDIEDPEASKEEYARAVDHFGETPLVRYGREPRVMLFYRKVPGPAEDYPEYRGAPVEIYCNSGLVILYGRHPSGEVYRWPEGNPLDTSKDEIPEVTAEALAQYIEGAPERRPRALRVAEAEPGGMVDPPAVAELEEVARFVFKEMFSRELEKMGIEPGSKAALGLLQIAEEFLEKEVKL